MHVGYLEVLRVRRESPAANADDWNHHTTAGAFLCLRPAHLAEHRLGVCIRHAEDAGEAQRLGRAGKEEMLRHISHAMFLSRKI